MASNNRLLAALIIVSSLLLVSILFNIDPFWSASEVDWKGSVKALVINFLSMLLATILVWLLVGYPHFSKSKKQYLGEDAINQISDVVAKASDPKEHLDSFVKALQNERRESSFPWEKHVNILGDLHDHWFQFIEDRKNIECQFTITKFFVDQDGKHKIEGANYRLDGSLHYKFETIKILPPMAIENDLVLYYVYRRFGTPEFEQKYGFGKIISFKKNKGEENRYGFASGFFFNEASDGYHPYKMKRASEILDFFQVDKKSDELNDRDRTIIFHKLISNGEPEKWGQKALHS